MWRSEPALAPVAPPEVLDCRGIPIEPGCVVVVAVIGGRLSERTVRGLEPRSPSGRWINVRFEGGGYTTPDRCAVVSPRSRQTPGGTE